MLRLLQIAELSPRSLSALSPNNSFAIFASIFPPAAPWKSTCSSQAALFISGDIPRTPFSTPIKAVPCHSEQATPVKNLITTTALLSTKKPPFSRELFLYFHMSLAETFHHFSQSFFIRSLIHIALICARSAAAFAAQHTADMPA